MTNRKELAEMLVEVETNSRELEFYYDGKWSLSQMMGCEYEYRLKPIIKYYRVWRWTINSNPSTVEGPAPFPPFDEWGEVGRSVSSIHIHDFEIEQ